MSANHRAFGLVAVATIILLTAGVVCHRLGDTDSGPRPGWLGWELLRLWRLGITFKQAMHSSELQSEPRPAARKAEHYQHKLRREIVQWAGSDSNRRLTDYESVALGH